MKTRTAHAVLTSGLLAAAAARAALPAWTPPLGSASLATNMMIVNGRWGIGQRGPWNEHSFLTLPAPTRELTLTHWLAVCDADGPPRGENGMIIVPGGEEHPYKPRATWCLPVLRYAPRWRSGGPDELGGAWGWGASNAPVALLTGVALTNAFDCLPAGAVRVEYIEATGTQWIDTEVAITPSHRIEADFQFTRVDVRQQRIFEQYERGGHLFVAYYINGSGNLGYAWSHVAADWKSAPSLGAMNTNRTLYAMDGPARKLWKGGSYGTLPLVDDNGPGEVTLTLGSKDTNVKPTHGRWFGARILLGSSLVRDFIPVRVGTAGYLYDRASGRLFGNASGEGEFLPGPDLPGRGGDDDPDAAALYPHGVYAVAWSDLAADATLTLGGTNHTLAAPSGARSVLPGPGPYESVSLSGSGPARVGIARQPVERIYQSGIAASDDDGDDGGDMQSMGQWLDARIVSTNWAFVAHRVRIGPTGHTNAYEIVQQGGTRYERGLENGPPPPGCDWLLPSGRYHLEWLAIGSMGLTFCYEWDRRVFPRWLSDEELESIREDGVRARASFGYESAVSTNAVRQTDP